MKTYKNIIITGASSGLGAALAEYYSGKGITLGLLGRNSDRLDGIAAKCKAKGADVICGLIDVRDADTMREWLQAFDDSHNVDLVIANAGISGGTAGGSETEQQIRSIFSTNIDGVLNTILPLINNMRRRHKGQIAIVSSLAALRGIPSAPAYSASKAAVRAYGEALRGDLAPYNVGVSVICPGYIKTPLTDVNNFPMPFIMSPEKAAIIIAKGLRRNKSRIAFPWIMYGIMQLMNLLPMFVSDKIFSALPKK